MSENKRYEDHLSESSKTVEIVSIFPEDPSEQSDITTIIKENKELKKNNFDLRLKLISSFDEPENMSQPPDAVLQENAELKVILSSKDVEIRKKTDLLIKAKHAIHILRQELNTQKQNLNKSQELFTHTHSKVLKEYESKINVLNSTVLSERRKHEECVEKSKLREVYYNDLLSEKNNEIQYITDKYEKIIEIMKQDTRDEVKNENVWKERYEKIVGVRDKLVGDLKRRTEENKRLVENAGVVREEYLKTCGTFRNDMREVIMQIQLIEQSNNEYSEKIRKIVEKGEIEKREMREKFEIEKKDMREKYENSIEMKNGIINRLNESLRRNGDYKNEIEVMRTKEKEMGEIINAMKTRFIDQINLVKLKHKELYDQINTTKSEIQKYKDNINKKVDNIDNDNTDTKFYTDKINVYQKKLQEMIIINKRMRKSKKEMTKMIYQCLEKNIQLIKKSSDSTIELLSASKYQHFDDILHELKEYDEYITSLKSYKIESSDNRENNVGFNVKLLSIVTILLRKLNEVILLHKNSERNVSHIRHVFNDYQKQFQKNVLYKINQLSEKNIKKVENKYSILKKRFVNMKKHIFNLQNIILRLKKKN